MRVPAPVHGTANIMLILHGAHAILLLGLMRTLGAESHSHTALETMADVTNDFGVCVLQVISSPSTNTVFSPYGLVSMALLVYEGATGQSAAEIYNTLHLPWHRDIVRIGFRDLHRYLRSYFSAEGFLKGLVLSKPNASLRLSYIEVLKFYGFQPDTSITQPITTQPSMDGSNETTTTLETSTLQPVTTMTTSKDELTTVNVQESTIKYSETVTTDEDSITLIPTVPPSLETTTNIMTLTDEPQTQPAVLDMKVENMTSDSTDLPQTTISRSDETTLLSTVANETIESDLVETESSISHKTTLEVTTEMYSTIEEKLSTTEEHQSIESTATQTALYQETAQPTTVQTEPSTMGMNVITLENMNMILETLNTTEETMETTQESISKPTSNTVDGTTSNVDVITDSGSVPAEKNDITTPETSTDHTVSDVTISTLFVDTTVPIEEFVVLTTPSDVDVLTKKDTSMLEAFILMEEDNTQKQTDLTTDYSLNKRSTVSSDEEVVKEPQSSESAILLNYIYSNINKPSKNHLPVQVNKPANQSTFYTDNNEILDSTKFTTQNSKEHFGQSTEPITEEMPTGFPTLEPDTIRFPTIKDPRLPRAIKGEGKPAELGNWVGATTGWHPSPTDQWFWTYYGDKLVPVLSHTAYLPHAKLPSLRASALQLPLDDVRYALVILLPDNARGLKQMLYSLQWHSLRDILGSLKATPVYSVVPSFTIVKHINLTPALYKLGIRHIFDAYHANLSELSSEPNLYVRTVEQVITISVQKYFTNHKRFEAAPGQVQQHFLATHPFAYFVVDVETKVALIAGTIVDPLLRSS